MKIELNENGKLVSFEGSTEEFKHVRTMLQDSSSSPDPVIEKLRNAVERTSTNHMKNELGVTWKSVDSWLSGQTKPSPSSLDKMKRYFDSIEEEQQQVLEDQQELKDQDRNTDTDLEDLPEMICESLRHLKGSRGVNYSQIGRDLNITESLPSRWANKNQPNMPNLLNSLSAALYLEDTYGMGPFPIPNDPVVRKAIRLYRKHGTLERTLEGIGAFRSLSSKAQVRELLLGQRHLSPTIRNHIMNLS